jgi:hypothetical protein
LLNHSHPNEIARSIGYNAVVLAKKGAGQSPYMYPDRRPGPDCDALFCNIYADLQKQTALGLMISFIFPNDAFV